MNIVILRGSVVATPEKREVDDARRTVYTFRLTVPRSDDDSGTVDTFDVVAYTTGTRRVASSLSEGDVAVVEGALRKRFWRSTISGASTRIEVEATAILLAAAKVEVQA